MLTAREMGRIEEKYYRDQLGNCLASDMFHVNVLQAGRE